MGLTNAIAIDSGFSRRIKSRGCYQNHTQMKLNLRIITYLSLLSLSAARHLRQSRVIGQPIPNESRKLEASIVDFEERVKEYYISKGLMSRGDHLQIDYTNVKYHVKELEIGDRTPIPAGDRTIDTVRIENKTPEVQEHQIKRINSVGHSISASVTAGFKLGASITVGIGIKKILNFSRTQSYEFSLSATGSVAKSYEEIVTSTFSTMVAPHSYMNATLQFETMAVSPTFVADVVIDLEPYYSGRKELYVAINRGTSRARYSTSLAEVLGVTNGNNGRFRSGKDDSQVLYKAEGRFRGITGRNVRIDYQECRMNDPDCGSPTKTGTLLLDGETSEVLRLDP